MNIILSIMSSIGALLLTCGVGMTIISSKHYKNETLPIIINICVSALCGIVVGIVVFNLL